MTSNSTKLPVLGSDGEIAVGLLDEWFDPIEAGLRDRVRDFVQTMMRVRLDSKATSIVLLVVLGVRGRAGCGACGPCSVGSAHRPTERPAPAPAQCRRRQSETLACAARA